MQKRLLLRGAVLGLLVLVLAVWSTAQLSGAYTIDPAGSGAKNYKTFAAAATALGADLAIDWWTIDGGGATFTAGGEFELSGTIGQPDAGPGSAGMSGGPYSLKGGFWVTPPCWCLADLNGDGLRDGDDIQGLLDCLLGSGFRCPCADVDANGILEIADVTVFVAGLLAGDACP